MTNTRVVCGSCGSSYLTQLAPEERRCPYQDRHTVQELETLRAIWREFQSGANPGTGKGRKRL